MGPAAAEPINPYASPQCAGGRPAPVAMALDEPIVLRGEINLAHEVLVLRRLRVRGTKWIGFPLATLALCASALCFHRFWKTGDPNVLWAALVPLLGAPCLLFLVSIVSWTFLALHFAILGLLGIPYQKSFWALVTGDGVRLRGSAGEEFQPWSSFSRMEMAGELIVLYGQGNLRDIPIVILNIHWCADSTDQDRLWSLLEAKFGGAAAEIGKGAPAKGPAPHPALTPPAIAGEEPIVLAGLVDLDQLLRIGRFKHQPVVKIVSIVFILAVILVGAFLWWSEPRPQFLIACGIKMAVLGLLCMWGLFKGQIEAWLLRRSFRGGRTRPQWTTWTISTSGVSMLSEALETHETWDQLRYRGEGENMLVLFNPASFRFHFLPREFATEEQWERLRALARGGGRAEG